MPDLKRAEVAGIPTYWVESGRPTLSASLIFRAGMADETLPTTGWLHLLEHLALHDRGKGSLHVNGSTSLLSTQFDFHGPRDAVVGALCDVMAWLATPDLSRYAVEAGVLRAESEFRGAGPVAHALLQRYGAGGPGLAGYAEPGLTRASRESLSALAAECFVLGNAVLAMDGPPPTELPNLRPGRRRAVRPAPC